MSSTPSSRQPTQSALSAALHSLWQDVLGALWRLGPGNPIADRTVSTASKRVRHFYIRLAYVGVLLLFMAVNFMQVAGSQAGLADLAKLNSKTFAWVSFAQLIMMCLLAPIFAAGAVSQQRDAETFNVLLTTPLTNGQIVLGTLLGRLFFVLALLVSGMPIFLLTMLYGGVTFPEILLSFSLAASAGLMMASVAICVGMFGVGTRQGVFSFYILIGFYLVAGLALAQFFPLASAPKAPLASTYMNIEHMPVYAWAHPVLALMAVLGVTQPPSIDAVAHLPWPMPFLLSRPAEGFVVVALLLSAVLNVAAMFAVRRASRMGEPGFFGKLLTSLIPARIQHNGEDRRRARHVWANPVAWREAVARASTPSQRAMRWFIFIAGTVAALILLMYWHSIPAKEQPAAHTVMQNMLSAVLIIEAVVAMVAAASAAGTAIARDRENGTFELMQTTPLTSNYILAGKLRGLVTLSAPLLVIPTLTALLFILSDLHRHPKVNILLNPAAVLAVPVVLLTHIAVVAIIGMHISLRQKNTTKAVLLSVGTVLLVYLPLTLACWGISKSVSIFSGLNPILFILTCINPQDMMGTAPTDTAAQAAWLLVTAAVCSIAILVGVWQGYVSMVKNFDFTLRKQT